MRQTQKVVGDRGQGILRYQKDGAGKIWIHRITVSNVLVAQQDEILDSMYDNSVVREGSRRSHESFKRTEARVLRLERNRS